MKLSIITLSGTVADYTGDPVLSINSKGDIDLRDITGAFPLPEGMDASGMIDFNISMNGAPSDLNTFKANGGINIKNVSAVMPETLKNPAIINGTINLTPTAVRIKNINIKSGKSDFDIKGNITNYMTLAGLGKDNAVLAGTLHSDLIDLNDMLVIEEKKDPETIKPWDLEETIKTLPIPPQLSMDVVVDVGTVIFGRLKSDSARGRITLKDGILEASELKLNAYQGILTGSSVIDMTDTTDVTYHGDFKLNAFESAGFIADLLGIGEIFRGKLSSSLSFSGAGLDSVSMLNNLKASGDMNFKNGQIVNWDFTKKLGDHLKFLDFDTIDFSAIKNSFRIENSKFITPDIILKSKAGDIRFDGVTGFDTSINYSFSMLLNKNTSEKAIKGIPVLSKLMSGSDNQIELLITARGTFMSPSFSLDTSKAEGQLKKQAKKEVEKVIDKILDKQGEDIKKKGEKILKNLFK